MLRATLTLRPVLNADQIFGQRVDRTFPCLVLINHWPPVAALRANVILFVLITKLHKLMVALQKVQVDDPGLRTVESGQWIEVLGPKTECRKSLSRARVGLSEAGHLIHLLQVS